MNTEIAIINMAMNVPQKVIDLNGWEFVCFVKHTQMVEQKLYEKEKETNCDIMFLVKREAKVRLMSFKNNPWLVPGEVPLRDIDPDVDRNKVFIFSGVLS